MEIADFEEETSPPSSIRRGSPGGMTPDRVSVFQGSESKHFRAEFQGSGFTNSNVVFQGSGSTNSGVPEETGQDASTPPPHHAGRSSPSRKRSPTDPDEAKMTLLAQAEVQVSQTLKKRTVEAMKAKQASLTQAAEDRKAKRNKSHSSDNMKSSQRVQLEGYMAGGSVKVLKRPASKLKAASGSGSLGSEVSHPARLKTHWSRFLWRRHPLPLDQARAEAAEEARAGARSRAGARARLSPRLPRKSLV